MKNEVDQAEAEKLNLISEAISNNTVSSEALAAQVVAYRVLGMNKQVAITCMQELSTRKAKGDTFDFELFIEQKIAEIPKPSKVEMQNLTGMLNIKTIQNLVKGLKR